MTRGGQVGRTALWVYFVLFIVFLFAPLVALLVFSVNDSPIPTLPMSGVTTKWFQQAFDNGALTGALVRSALLGVIASILATALAIMASIGLSGGRLRMRTLGRASNASHARRQDGSTRPPRFEAGHVAALGQGDLERVGATGG